MVDAVCVPPDQTALAWPFIEKYVKAAIAETSMVDIDMLRRKLATGEYLLWLACEGREVLAAAVTSLEKANGVKFATIIICGGHSMERWVSLIGRLEAWARVEGARHISIWGRRGWLRVLDGYRDKAVILEKELK